MPKSILPKLIQRPKRVHDTRVCTAHRAWVRKHKCSVPECDRLPIECAHVRSGTDGGTALKPSDRWLLSLCAYHHQQQHCIGEAAFEKRHAIDLKELSTAFAQQSPYKSNLKT